MRPRGSSRALGRLTASSWCLVVMYGGDDLGVVYGVRYVQCNDAMADRQVASGPSGVLLCVEQAGKQAVGDWKRRMNLYREKKLEIRRRQSRERMACPFKVASPEDVMARLLSSC